MLQPTEGAYLEGIRFRLTVGVMMHGPGVENHYCILGNEAASVREIVTGYMGLSLARMDYVPIQPPSQWHGNMADSSYL
jgi:hypothetical protein